MGIKGNCWTRPSRKKKSDQKRLPAWSRALPGVVVLVFLLWIVIYFHERPAAVPAAYQAAPALPERSSSLWLTLFLQKMLGDSLPGLQSPSLDGRKYIQEAAFSALRSLTGLDLRDPRTFLELELGDGPQLPPMPVLQPVAPDFPPPSDRSNGEGQPVTSAPPREEVPETSFRPDFKLQAGGEPVILIYHSHITESFLPTSGVYFTENLELTVYRLGVQLAEILQEQYGLPVLHDRQVFDIPRRYAYEKARPALEKILAENPQLKMLIDLHRDGVSRELTTVQMEGKSVGRILLVVGTLHPLHNNNLRAALQLQREIEAIAPGLSRGIRQQKFIYNQDLHPYSLLIEVGGHENSLEEVADTLPYLAEALARSYHALFIRAE